MGGGIDPRLLARPAAPFSFDTNSAVNYSPSVPTASFPTTSPPTLQSSAAPPKTKNAPIAFTFSTEDELEAADPNTSMSSTLSSTAPLFAFTSMTPSFTFTSTTPSFTFAPAATSNTSSQPSQCAVQTGNSYLTPEQRKFNYDPDVENARHLKERHSRHWRQNAERNTTKKAYDKLIANIVAKYGRAGKIAIISGQPLQPVAASDSTTGHLPISISSIPSSTSTPSNPTSFSAPPPPSHSSIEFGTASRTSYEPTTQPSSVDVEMSPAPTNGNKIQLSEHGAQSSTHQAHNANAAIYLNGNTHPAEVTEGDTYIQDDTAALSTNPSMSQSHVNCTPGTPIGLDVKMPDNGATLPRKRQDNIPAVQRHYEKVNKRLTKHNKENDKKIKENDYLIMKLRLQVRAASRKDSQYTSRTRVTKTAAKDLKKRVKSFTGSSFHAQCELHRFFEESSANHQREVQRLQQANQQLQQANKQLQLEKQNTQVTPDHANKLTLLNGQITQHLAIIESRESTITQLQNDHPIALNAKDSRIAGLLADVAKYESNAKSRNSELARRKNELKQGERTIAALRKEIQIMKRSRKMVKAARGANISRIINLEKEKETIEIQVATKISELDAETQKVTKLTEERDAAQAVQRKVQRELDELKSPFELKELEPSVNEIMATVAWRRTADECRREFVDWRNKANDLEQRLATLSLFKDDRGQVKQETLTSKKAKDCVEVMNLKSEVKAEKKQNARLEATIKVLKAQLSKKTAAETAWIRKVERKDAEVKAINAEAEKKIEDCIAERDAILKKADLHIERLESYRAFAFSHPKSYSYYLEYEQKWATEQGNLEKQQLLQRLLATPNEEIDEALRQEYLRLQIARIQICAAEDARVIHSKAKKAELSITHPQKAFEIVSEPKAVKCSIVEPQTTFEVILKGETKVTELLISPQMGFYCDEESSELVHLSNPKPLPAMKANNEQSAEVHTHRIISQPQSAVRANADKTSKKIDNTQLETQALVVAVPEKLFPHKKTRRSKRKPKNPAPPEPNPVWNFGLPAWRSVNLTKAIFLTPLVLALWLSRGIIT